MKKKKKDKKEMLLFDPEFVMMSAQQTDARSDDAKASISHALFVAFSNASIMTVLKIYLFCFKFNSGNILERTHSSF